MPSTQQYKPTKTDPESNKNETKGKHVQNDKHWTEIRRAALETNWNVTKLKRKKKSQN